MATELNLEPAGPLPELLKALVEDRVGKTLDTLVVSHRNGNLTAQEALSGIATIAALRLLPADLVRKIKNFH